MKILDGGRISIAALSLGIAKGAFDASVKYAKEREQFGQPIANFQAIAFKLADMATRIEAAELLIQQASDLKNNGQEDDHQEGAMAKYYASEVASGPAMKRYRSSGDTAIPRIFRWRSSTAIASCAPSAKAPARSRSWSSAGMC